MTLTEKCWLQPQTYAGETRIATLVRQTIHCSDGHPGIYAFGRKHPVALVVVEKAGAQIIHLDDSAAALLENKNIRADIQEFLADGSTN